MSDKKSSLGWSPVTDGQMREFYRLKEDKIISNENLSSFLSNPNKFSRFASLDAAIEILGKDHIVTHKKAAKCLKNQIDHIPNLYYSEKTLKMAAKSNLEKPKYYLVYLNGNTLSNLVDSAPQYFHKETFDTLKECSWFRFSGFTAGYYLLNLTTLGCRGTYVDHLIESYTNLWAKPVNEIMAIEASVILSAVYQIQCFQYPMTKTMVLKGFQPGIHKDANGNDLFYGCYYEENKISVMRSEELDKHHIFQLCIVQREFEM